MPVSVPAGASWPGWRRCRDSIWPDHRPIGLIGAHPPGAECTHEVRIGGDVHIVVEGRVRW